MIHVGGIFEYFCGARWIAEFEDSGIFLVPMYVLSRQNVA